MPYTPIPPVIQDQVIDPAWGNTVDTAMTEVQAFATAYEARDNYLCQVSMSAAQSIISGATTNPLLYTVDDIDPLDWHSTVTQTDRITPTIPGWYRATVTGDWQSDSDYTRILLDVRRNNSTMTPTNRAEYGVHSGTNSSSVTTPLILMNGTTDYLNSYAFSTNTSANANTFRGVFLVEWVRGV